MRRVMDLEGGVEEMEGERTKGVEGKTFFHAKLYGIEVHIGAVIKDIKFHFVCHNHKSFDFSYNQIQKMNTLSLYYIYMNL